jgi:hypothetical protein
MGNDECRMTKDEGMTNDEDAEKGEPRIDAQTGESPRRTERLSLLPVRWRCLRNSRAARRSALADIGGL